ncbi:hypothetical protein GINT2_000646 [Glugoides intestinalis]
MTVNAGSLIKQKKGVIKSSLEMVLNNSNRLFITGISVIFLIYFLFKRIKYIKKNRFEKSTKDYFLFIANHLILFILFLAIYHIIPDFALKIAPERSYFAFVLIAHHFFLTVKILFASFSVLKKVNQSLFAIFKLTPSNISHSVSFDVLTLLALLATVFTNPRVGFYMWFGGYIICMFLFALNLLDLLLLNILVCIEMLKHQKDVFSFSRFYPGKSREIPSLEEFLNVLNKLPLKEAGFQKGNFYGKEILATNLQEIAPVKLEGNTPPNLDQASPPNLDQASPPNLDQASPPNLDQASPPNLGESKVYKSDKTVSLVSKNENMEEEAITLSTFLFEPSDAAEVETPTNSI